MRKPLLIGHVLIIFEKEKYIRKKNRADKEIVNVFSSLSLILLKHLHYIQNCGCVQILKINVLFIAINFKYY